MQAALKSHRRRDREEEEEEASVSLAAAASAKETSVDAGGTSVLSNLNDIFTLNKNEELN